MNAVAFVIALIFGLMLAEQRASARHEQQLRAEGAIEPPGDVYRALALTYPAAFLIMGLEGIWRASHQAAAAGGPSWAASGVVLFVVSKMLKYWAIRALGHRWSFRVLVLPGRPLVSDGPYRYVDHPNYIAVIGELVATALMVGARVTGPIAGAGFGIVLWRRWRFERRVLADARAKRVSPAGVD
ncbi:MAG: hypothetical protein IT184_10145 [Acidobacteria bacterium]|nr:hypothetical protein [Acidobacteriota bacterium]